MAAPLVALLQHGRFGGRLRGRQHRRLSDGAAEGSSEGNDVGSSVGGRTERDGAAPWAPATAALWGQASETPSARGSERSWAPKMAAPLVAVLAAQ